MSVTQDIRNPPWGDDSKRIKFSVPVPDWVKFYPSMEWMNASESSVDIQIGDDEGEM